MSTRLILGTLAGFAARVIDSSTLEREHIERVAVSVLSADGTEEDVAAAVELLLEDAVDWTQVIRGPAGVIIEDVEDPLIRVAAARIARRICRRWAQLGDGARLERLRALFPPKAASEQEG